MTREIALTNGGVALIDDEDFDRVNSHPWRLGNRGYPLRKVYVRGSGARNPRYKTILLHRFIAEAPAGVQVDHVNGTKADCRRSNLRCCVNKENSRNMRPKTALGLKGVHAHQNSRRWRARITVDGREIHLGMFDTPQLAAAAYNDAAREYFGAFAYINPLGAEA